MWQKDTAHWGPEEMRSELSVMLVYLDHINPHEDFRGCVFGNTIGDLAFCVLILLRNGINQERALQNTNIHTHARTQARTHIEVNNYTYTNMQLCNGVLFFWNSKVTQRRP